MHACSAAGTVLLNVRQRQTKLWLRTGTEGTNGWVVKTMATAHSNILRRGCFPLSPFCPHHAAIHGYRAQLTNVCFHHVAMPRYHVRMAF